MWQKIKLWQGEHSKHTVFSKNTCNCDIYHRIFAVNHDIYGVEMKALKLLETLIGIEESKVQGLEKEEAELKKALAEITDLGFQIEERMVPKLTYVKSFDNIELSPENVQARIKEMAKKIAQSGVKNPLLLGVLDGALPFFSALQKELNESYPEFRYTFATTFSTSYVGERSTGKRIIVDSKEPMGGRNVIIIEDLIETGGTLQDLADHIKNDLGATSVEAVVLLDKVQERKKFTVVISDVGFSVPKESFVLGEGMDRDSFFRNSRGVAIKGSGDPMPEEQAFLDWKGKLNTKLQTCLAAKKASLDALKDYKVERDALLRKDDAVASSQENAANVGTHPYTMYGSTSPEPKNPGLLTLADTKTDEQRARATMV